ncbi:MAG: hypothetical protein LBR21_07500 [Propionibacteriaceae bacterium]|nr:hypothetical protein [Propionibacteriaceae bacterium]
MAKFGRNKAPEASVGQVVAAEPTARTVVAHRDFLLSHVEQAKPFGIGLFEARGLTLCETLASDIDLPLFSAATVDGWAVRASNLVGASPQRPIAMPVMGEVVGANTLPEPLPVGATFRVSAGAPIPSGADAVVPYADATELGDGASFEAEIPVRSNVRERGTRVSDGSLLAVKGSELTPKVIAALSEVGIDKVLALPKPRVAVGSIGNDLVAPGAPLTRLRQRYDYTTALYATAVEAYGCQAFPMPILDEDEQEIARSIKAQAISSDLILLIGEATDSLRAALAATGEVDYAQVAIRPAGPQLFAVVGEEKVPLLVLPPQAASSYVSFEVFAVPLLLKLAGLDPLEREVINQVPDEKLPFDPDVPQFLLASLKDGLQLLNLGEDAGAIELREVDVIVVVPPGQEIVPGRKAVCWVPER